MRLYAFWFAVILFLFCDGEYLDAQTIDTRWYGSTSGDWTNAGSFPVFNWQGGSVPNNTTIVGLGNGDSAVDVGNFDLTIPTTGSAGAIIFYNDPLATFTTQSYTVGSSGQGVVIASGGSIVVQSAVAANQTFGANVGGTGALTINNQSNSSSLTFNGNVARTGGSNNLTVNNASGLIDFNGSVNTGNVSVGSNSGTVRFDGSVDTGTISVGSNSGTVRFDGAVTATSLTVDAGTGEVIFGSNGSQSIGGGILATGGSVSGLANISTSLTVASGTTYSPGNGLNAVGTQSIANLNFESGSVFQWDLTGIGIGDFDTVVVTGALSLNNTASVLKLDLGSFNENVPWTRTIFSANSITGTFNQDGITLAGDFLGFPNVTASQFSWSVDGSNVNLNFAAVPEPSSIVLLGLAGVAGFWGRRKRKTVNDSEVFES
ncbi:PEP-CTERM sorting domain-containing protein [Pirellulaceae bacterium SH449]